MSFLYTPPDKWEGGRRDGWNLRERTKCSDWNFLLWFGGNRRSSATDFHRLSHWMCSVYKLHLHLLCARLWVMHMYENNVFSFLLNISMWSMPHKNHTIAETLPAHKHTQSHLNECVQFVYHIANECSVRHHIASHRFSSVRRYRGCFFV